MIAEETGEASTGADAVDLDHWIYGVVRGEGYTTKAISHGLTVGLYDQYLRGHYTPIRAATVQSEGPFGLRMIHPVGSGEEVLLSRLSRGPPDEAGRPTFANHTAIVATQLLRSGRITLEAIYDAIEASEKDKKAIDSAGQMNRLSVPSQPPGTVGSVVHRYVSLPALETLATRILMDPHNRTLLLCRDSTADSRNQTMCSIVEILCWACGLPPFAGISDAPTASAINFFKLVVAPRGVRADSQWALLDSALGEAALPRIPGHEGVYEVLAAAYNQSLRGRTAAGVRVAP